MTTRKSTAKPRNSRTRADVKEAFEEISAEQENAPVLDTKAKDLARERATSVLSAVQGLSLDNIIQKGSTLGLEISRLLSNVTEQLSAKVNELDTVKEAVRLETAELERLYGLDVASAALHVLIEEHEEKKAAFDLESQKVIDAWEAEKINHRNQIAERDAELQKARARENDQYEYNKRTERQKKEDDFAQKMLLQSREMQDRQTVFDKSITERSAILAAQEADYAAAKKRIEGLDAEIDAAVKKEVAIATNSLKSALTHAHALELKDKEMALQLERQKVTTAEAHSARLAEQVISLTKALDGAREQVQSISVAALQSASGQVALTKVQETLSAQKDNSGQKRS